MYLKSLYMVGFKSFAEKIRLEFEPGLTCVVGPNGCGKSNISDAVRWVIGEQSAKALRGSSMTDCIFNGTDARKPLGMAEVSITFADCDTDLETEYNEITVTRRVFRDGQGAYFINKTPCRLKDIQRLFMDTGVGTTSYSLMEQGRIDRVLSARPEDRRAVFEEASGITKFKNDKKEAIRKLDRTEANLLRLADVIREVKRQIGSLQRQAGKARRYKALRDDLRAHDVFLTRERVRGIDASLDKVEKDLAKIDAKLETSNQQVHALEGNSADIRRSLTETEREVEALLEKNVQAKGRLNHTRETIATNKRRIEEYQSWATRDSREIDENRRLLEEHRRHVVQLDEKLSAGQNKRNRTDTELQAANETFGQHRQRIDDARARVEKLREESVEFEGLAVRLQNELVELETRERSSVLQRERLSSEKGQLARSAEAFRRRKEEMLQALEKESANVNKLGTGLEDLEKQRRSMEDEIRRTRQTCSDLQSQSAAKRARLDVVREADEAADDESEASRALLADDTPFGIDGSKLLGAFVSRLDVDSEYRVAVETALRVTLDAILVRDTAAAADILAALEREKAGSARLLVLERGNELADVATTAPEGAEALIEHVRCDDETRPLLARLLRHVYVVTAPGAISAAPEGVTLVTRSGSVMRADGYAEFSMPQAESASALGRKDLMRRLDEELATLSAEVERWQANAVALTDQAAALDDSIRNARLQLDEAKRIFAQKEGESQVLTNEATEAKDRLETVSWELEELAKQGKDSDDQRREIGDRITAARDQRAGVATAIREQNETLHKLESRHTELQTALTDVRVRAAEVTQELRHLELQSTAAQSRTADLERAVDGRKAGLQSYRDSIQRLTGEIAEAEGSLETLEKQVAEGDSQAEALRTRKQQQEGSLEKVERDLTELRETLDAIRSEKSAMDIRKAEDGMRRQNQIERVMSEYAITVDELIEAPDPEWKGEPPSLDAVETMVAEARTKLDAMGPVNLVAIEEYKELEERYAFLTAQEQDLTTSKTQLMEMIRKINATTSEMFRSTFDEVNTNFQRMFHRLFNGGSAKLVLVNEEDILECGIEIIARPPGKRLQNVSLLSGGERTLTAVALLFAIYMIKPSPFCLLDELDAALDDANIGRFVDVLKDFLNQSQFIVITHNRRTIAAASAVYGVTMPEKGISRMMSMKFNASEEPQLEMAES